jgi:hypothetical protein
MGRSSRLRELRVAAWTAGAARGFSGGGGAVYGERGVIGAVGVERGPYVIFLT